MKGKVNERVCSMSTSCRVWFFVIMRRRMRKAEAATHATICVVAASGCDYMDFMQQGQWPTEHEGSKG